MSVVTEYKSATMKRYNTADLHNSESSKGQIDQRKLAAGRKVYFVVEWKKF